jgi:hypothetical protein
MDFGKFRTKTDFVEIYCNADEDLPHWMPEPHSQSVIMTAVVDATHAANKMTRQSLSLCGIVNAKKRLNRVQFG